MIRLGKMDHILQNFKAFCSDIKVTHSVFALPFAASILFIHPVPFPTWYELGLLVGCMVMARSWAMGMNRYLDKDVDVINERTSSRAIPNGQLSAIACLVLSCLSATLFIVLSWELHPLAGKLSIPVLAILASYSLCKRFTWLSHFYLGMCLGMAPIAVIVALQGEWSWLAALMGLAIALWTGGFDMLYALQDMKFDQQNKLHSIPAKFGAHRTVIWSRISFFCAVILLILVGVSANQGPAYYLGVMLVASILVWQHWLLRDMDTDGKSAQTGRAFFQANAMVSVVYLVFVSISWWLHG